MSLTNCEISHAIIDIAFLYKLPQIVNMATHITPECRSLLEPYFVSESMEPLGALARVMKGLSDHGLIVCGLLRVARVTAPRPNKQYTD